MKGFTSGKKSDILNNTLFGGLLSGFPGESGKKGGLDTEQSFFALISRMRYIRRWGLMRNSEPENVQEHSHAVAVLAHALAVIRRDVFGVPCDPNEAAALALFHDASEILTGDLPTPIKYNNPDIRRSYGDIERYAERRIVELLPEELRGAYEPLVCSAENPLHSIVKAADKLAACIKCIEERKAGNLEFRTAERQCREKLLSSGLPEVSYFMEHFLPAYELDLDELRTMEYEEGELK